MQVKLTMKNLKLLRTLLRSTMGILIPATHRESGKKAASKYHFTLVS
jgi:hypothetical protein